MPFLKVSGIRYLVSGIRNTKYKILNTKYRKPVGFTLIELLIVITIIGILASIALVSYNGAQARSRDSKRKQDLKTIKDALELAKQDTAGAYNYPVCANGTASCNIGDNGVIPNVNTNPALSTTYIKSIPEDPKTQTGYTYSTFGADGTTACSTNCVRYKLIACLENTTDSQKDTNNTCTSPLVSYTINTD